MNETQKRSAFPERSKNWIALGVALLVLLVFFRQQFLNHFSYLTSDRYDGVIEAALLEHWFNVFRGLSDWSSPNYFYPYAKTLSYNEGLFLYGIIYSVFRTFSIDAFLSSELLNIVIKGLGFFGMYIAAQKILKVSFLWTLLGATIFTLGNNSFIQASHAQLLSVSLAPIEAWLIYEACQALMASRTRGLLTFGSLAGLLFSAWLLTCLYTAWFFTLFAFIMLAVQLCTLGGPGLAKLKRAVLANKLAILAIMALTIISLMPFVSVYFSGSKGVKPREWSEILFYIPTISDSFNVGGGNLLFGHLIDLIRDHCSTCGFGTGEREAGIAPVLFVLAVISMVTIIAKRHLLPPAQKMFIYGIAVASAITWLLSIRIGGVVSAWYLIYKFWPGGSGLRVVSRIFLFLAVPLTGLVIWHLSRAKWPRTLLLALCALLVMEEINGLKTTTLDRFQQIDRTANVPKAPAQCRSFFTTESPDTVDSDPDFIVGSIYPHNVDAMLIAEYVNLPTINGWASFNPPDWNFASSSKSDYLLRVQAYAKAHDLQGLCKLDLATKQWDTHPVLAETKDSLGYWNFSEAIPEETLKGFSNAEQFGRWSIGPEASFKYTLPKHPNQETLEVRITVVTALVSDNHAQRLRISVNGKEQPEFVFKNTARGNVRFVVPVPADNQVDIKMAFPDAISPKEIGMNADTRPLAIGVKSIELR
jgi:uncharacterized protein (DUF983 family)